MPKAPRKRSSLDADRTSALLGAIVDSSDDAIISKDLNGTITSWNQAAERIFGYTAAEAIGRSITMLIPPDRLGEEPRIIERLKRGERVDHFETRRIRKDGTLLDISLTISPVKDADGRIVGASKIARDICERRRAEEELRRQRAIVEQLYEVEQSLRREAELAGRAKDEFLAMLAHELRNPLSSVHNAVVAASLDPSFSERALGIIRRGTAQLTRLVDDLLDVARITQGKIELRKERLSLAAIVDQAREATRATLDQRRHRLSVSLEDPDLEVEGDAARLEQVVVNLLSNAAKFSDPGGAIRVSVAREGAAAVLRVRDSGIGIAADLLPRIFDLFAQGDSGLARSTGGLGVGLTVVKRIVELHGGRIAAHSEGLGKGAEFVVSLLPAASRASDAMPARGDAPQPRARVVTTRTRILLIEDNADAADSMRMLLERLGHEVKVIHEGSAAGELARRDRPDFIFIDIGLPGMDGYEVARQLRDELAPEGPVLVALTGYGAPEDKRRARAAGFDHHFTKPVNLPDLRALTETDPSKH